MEIQFDRVVETISRGLSRRLSRRNMLTTMGRAMLGGMIVPLLPVDRLVPAANAAEGETARDDEEALHGWDDSKAQTNDPTQCDYWRYCASDGYMCSCCGGSPSACPPGSVPAPSAWVGTCFNPDDKKHYIIKYRDCCSNKGSCGRCACLGLKNEKPVYMPQLNNDIVWCYGAPSMVYHCSGAVVVGEA